MQRTPVTFDLRLLELVAKDRPPGYVQDVTSRGTVKGGRVTLSHREYRRLCRKYRPLRGLGDVIARITGWFRIRQCGGCRRRQRTLNRWIPFRHVLKKRR